MKKFLSTIILGSMLTVIPANAADAGPATQPSMLQVSVSLDGNNAASTANALADVVTLMDQAKTEKVAWLGVSTSKPPLALLKQLKIKSGLVVDEVVAGSPAEAAGLKPQDLLEKFDDQMLINPAQLEGLIRMHNAGESISLSILHEGEHAIAAAKLVEHQVLAAQGDPVTGNRVYIRELDNGKTPAIEQFKLNSLPGIQGLKIGQGSVQVMTSVQSDSKDGNGQMMNFHSQFADGTHQLTIVSQGDKKVLTAKDSDGKTIFEGPVDTTEQEKAIPEAILAKFRQMQKMEVMTSDSAKARP